jgi:hypothetical protein
MFDLSCIMNVMSANDLEQKYDKALSRPRCCIKIYHDGI